MRYTVGLNLPLKSRCHESGVALINEYGEVLFAMNEERLSRKKLDGDFPVLSMASMFAYSGIRPEEVSHVVVPALGGLARYARFAHFLWRERFWWIFEPRVWRMLVNLYRGERKATTVAGEEQPGFTMKYYWRDFIKDKFPNAQIVQVDHHTAHAASAYYTSPWSDALVVTIDGAGNLLSSVVAEGSAGELVVRAKTFIPHSLGTFWGSVTKVCGFQSGTRHGGKVTGLSALGDPQKLIGLFRELVWCEGLHIKMKEEVFFDRGQLIPDWGSYQPERLKMLAGADGKTVGEYTREDIAAGAQLRLEEVACQLVRNAAAAGHIKTPLKLVCAGGVFANVKMNQRLLELPEVDDLYIFPAMSDGGIALGAALHCLAGQKRAQGTRLLPQALKSPYLGPDYSEEEIEKHLKEKGLLYTREATPEHLAALLEEGRVVAVSEGRMEYGPRALGNRTIMYAASDPKVNDWLNKRLKRSEFMPFAPVTLVEHLVENYEGIAQEPIAAKYMTITYQCTEKMRREAPACVHVDGTARPQAIGRGDNPFYYDIVAAYYKRTGIPTLINTSFNMHEEPIVCSPEDSTRAFLASGIDYLALGPFLLSFEDNKHLAEEA